MKKRNDEELDEILEDDEVLEDEADDVVLDDDEVIDDEVIDDDEVIEDDELEEEPKGKKDKKAKKAKKEGKKGKDGKKKLSKGAVIGISVSSSVVGVVAIVLVVLFVILPLFNKSKIADDFEALLAVNGYQNASAADAVARDPSRMVADPSYDSIVSVDDMLEAMHVSSYTELPKEEFAAALYSLAITNYSNIDGRGWYCYTDSSVYAKDVTATLAGLTLSFPTFNVGVRAAYGLGEMEAANPNDTQAELEKKNMFSQTISGVSKLDIEGLPKNLTGALTALFGYNVQEFLYDGIYAYRRAKNGGAEFLGASDSDGAKYLMGARNEAFPSKIKVKSKSEKEGGYPTNTFIVDEYKDEYAETKTVVKTEIPEKYDTVIRTGTAGWEPWGELDRIAEMAYTLQPYDLEETYVCGNYGVGWAAYNFSKEYIDPDKTTIEYDAKNGVYIIEMAVLADKQDEACVFAKGSLTRDTKDYIQMQESKYTLEKNHIEIYANGLIKYWERIETVSSENKCLLTVMPGECAGGGGTTNHTYMSFSYSAIDYNPLALAKRYMSEIASTEAGVKATYANKLAKAMEKWPSFDDYDPTNKTKAKQYLSLT